MVAVLLYNIFIWLYNGGISVAALFNGKARLWKDGRKGIFNRLRSSLGTVDHVIWMHCASLGEFEQGRLVLESLRKEYPGHKILLTFFSPSGYEIRKNYNGADWVYYLPLDTPQNVKQFLDIVNPSLAIFVKYEYWYNYLNQLNKRNIPTFLISAIFREDKIFFKWYGALHRKMLGFFDHIFLQDEQSAKLLTPILSEEKLTVAGDTRFDRVTEIAAGFQPIAPIEKFAENRIVLVAGSTWPEDERNLKIISEKFKDKISLIVVPHEVTKSHINFLKGLFIDSVLYSELSTSFQDINFISNKKTLIINNIGMLSKLYYYADICYIGGGFNQSGIHNTLEAAVYGKPVIFGPNYDKFSEAVSLIQNKGGYSYSNDIELIDIILILLTNADQLKISGDIAGQFVSESTGATAKVLSHLRQISF